MSSIEIPLRDLFQNVARDVLREELRAALDEFGGSPATPTSPPSSTPRYLSAREAADVAGVHPKTVRAWTQEGGLPVYRLELSRRRPRFLKSRTPSATARICHA